MPRIIEDAENCHDRFHQLSTFSALTFSTLIQVIDSLNHHGFPRIGSELEIAKSCFLLA